MCKYDCLDQSAADGAGDAADSLPGASQEYIGAVTGKRHKQFFHWACTAWRGKYVDIKNSH